MNRLSSYVSAILNQSSPVRIVQQSNVCESWVDQGFVVQKETTTYRFDNGVVVRREQEQDQFPADLACAECWISYQVLESGNQSEIDPPSKNFANACRESFWLAYQRAD